MKKLVCLILGTIWSLSLPAQDFTKSLTEARTTYAAGNLSNARFAMEQMLQELDVALGQDILKALPAKLETLPANVTNDEISGGAIGLTIQRSYGSGAKTAEVEIMNNSPLLASLNALLALPFATNTVDNNQKKVKVQGFKAVLNKTSDDTGKANFELQVPLQNTLLTFKVNNSQEAEVLRLAEALPLDKIAQLAK